MLSLNFPPTSSKVIHFKFHDLCVIRVHEQHFFFFIFIDGTTSHELSESGTVVPLFVRRVRSIANLWNEDLQLSLIRG